MRVEYGEIAIAVGESEEDCKKFAGAISNMPADFGRNYRVITLKNGAAVRIKYEDIMRDRIKDVRAIIIENNHHYGGYSVTEQYLGEMKKKGVKVLILGHVEGNGDLERMALSAGAFACIPGKSLFVVGDTLEKALTLNTDPDSK
ncbi:MAG: hypothetical protein AABW63_01675 [Nanoarchaeota archaeon]|mgnify:FL=1